MENNCCGVRLSVDPERDGQLAVDPEQGVELGLEQDRSMALAAEPEQGPELTIGDNRYIQLEGEPMIQGKPGQDGFSPIVEVEDIEGGHKVTITDVNGPHIFLVMNGEDGVSPTVTVTEISGGHRITITDASGEHTFDVLNGDGTYTLPLAADGTRGGVQIGYTQSGKNYPVQLDNEKMYVNVPWTDTDTKNTAGSTDSNSKLYLIGATSQTTNPQTYSQDTAYVGTDGCLYSGGAKVLTAHQDIGNKKNVQTAVADPAVDGTGVTFIDSISQDSQGVISPHKRTVRTMNGASADEAGLTGLVPRPAAGKHNSFLRGDGTWQTPPGTYSLPLAANGTRGGVQIGYTQSGKNYPVQLSNEKMYVNVPWEDTHQDISGKKNVQTAVSDPTADGTGVTFIDTISQDIQGVITPHKRTVRTMGGASASAAGSSGLVPAPASGAQGKFFRGDATWQQAFVPYGDAADCDALTEPGLYRIAGTATQNRPFGWGTLLHQVTANGVITQIGVEQLNHQLWFRTYENGAWSAWQKVVRTGDVMGGASASAAGSSGLVPTPAAGKQAAYLRGDGTWQTPPGTYSLPLAANGTRGGVQIGYTQSGKNYPVQLSNEKMYVNVPWEDHHAWSDITGRPTVQNTLNSSSTTDVLSAYQGMVLKAMITEESVFYTGIVDVTSGRTLTVSDNVDNLIFMQFMFSINNPATSTSKGMLLIPRYGSANNAWYPLCVGGTMGGIRLNASGQSVEIFGTSGFTTLYLTTIFGIMVRNPTT